MRKLYEKHDILKPMDCPKCDKQTLLNKNEKKIIWDCQKNRVTKRVE